MTAATIGDWAVWFLILTVFGIVMTITSSLCAAGIAWYTTRLRGRLTLAFQFKEDGKDTTVYVYNDEHWLIRSVVDELVARKQEIEDLEAQNGQLGVLNDSPERKSSLIAALTRLG